MVHKTTRRTIANKIGKQKDATKKILQSSPPQDDPDRSGQDVPSTAVNMVSQWLEMTFADDESTLESTIRNNYGCNSR